MIFDNNTTDIDKTIVKSKLFPVYDNLNVLDSVMIDVDSVSYISIPADADKITTIIKQHCSQLNLNYSSLSITDATAGVGGNTISFASNFMHVNAIEMESNRYKCLVNNLEVYKLTNVLHYCDDCLKIIYKLKQQDILFLDPPWGGKGYKKSENIRLSISNISLEDICIDLFDENKTNYVPNIICLKLPKNYDLRHLYFTLMNHNKKLEIYCYDLYKMFIIIIQNKI